MQPNTKDERSFSYWTTEMQWSANQEAQKRKNLVFIDWTRVSWSLKTSCPTVRERKGKRQIYIERQNGTQC